MRKYRFTADTDRRKRRKFVCVWPWHLELTWPVRKHRVDGEHDGCSLGEGSDACRALALRRRADRDHVRSSCGRLGAAPGFDLVDLSRQAATGGAATPRSDCSTASASA
jgi:hypothetical protein